MIHSILMEHIKHNQNELFHSYVNSCDPNVATLMSGRWRTMLNFQQAFLCGVSVQQAELWAIFDGLTLAWDYGFGNIILEVDN